MWGQKFGFVVGNALSFPFKQFGKIKGLFFATAILLMAVALIAFILFGGTIIALAQHSKLHPEMMSQAGVGAGFSLLPLVGGLLLMFAMLPYLVGIIRAVVLDEKADSSVLSAMFAGRQLSYLWANIKIVLMVFLIMLPVGFLYGFFAIIFIWPAATTTGYAGWAVAGTILISIMTILLIAFIVRWYLAPVTAALDRGTSLRGSWELTRGSWWLIVLSFIVVGIVVNIFSWLVMFMAGMLFLPMAIMAGPNMMGSVTGMISMGVYGILYVLLTLATMMPGTALYGYIYLVVTGQVMFGEPEIKQVVEK
jgi:hypothetical protein